MLIEVKNGIWYLGGGGRGWCGGEMEFLLSSDLTYFTSPPEIQTLTFSSEFRFDLFHITSPQIQTVAFSSELRSDLFHTPPPP